MSVQLNPSNQLGFNRPLTQIVRRTLTVTNHNSAPVAFKVKTTAPKLYCVRPNSGIIEPDQSVDVQVLLQAMREDPPLSTKCKDKFLVQSMIIVPERRGRTAHEMWQFEEDEPQPQIHQQKIKVVYLPQEGEVLEEEDIGHMSTMTEGESRFETTRTTVGDTTRDTRSPPPMPTFPSAPKPAPQPAPPKAVSPGPRPAPVPASARSMPSPPSPTPSPPPFERPQSPAAQEYSIAEEVVTHHEIIEPLAEQKPPTPNVVNINVVTPSQPPTPAPVSDRQTNAAQDAAFAELNQRYAEAQIEINRLRGLLASIPPAGTTLRRRNKVMSDDGSTVIGDDVSEEGTVIETETATMVQPEGVPLQFVVLIALVSLAWYFQDHIPWD
ncbi:Vesicle-associated membrane protein-associated protein C16G5,05c [Ceratobasidium theobromae]|uniref:Vesicle-associated membrane protein-associated protein C16G5,05c n=1 Tax=Ceratobasidium theobromae TaxID=1582974 RepID=A0A5N5QCF2_9AGAM|nr:Vesicle-associated membrane protein-associated protein C16G5,05c [Ceratobasidium theobromae]